MDIQAYILSGEIESYVLGLSDPAEVAEVEKLKAQHPEVQEAIDDFAILLEKQAFQNAVAPPADIKSKLMLDLAGEFKSAATNSLKVAYSNHSDENVGNVKVVKTNTWRLTAAASIILLVGSAVTNLYLYNRYSSTNTQYQALLSERTSLQASNQVYQTKVRDYQTAAEMMADPAFAMVKMFDPAKKQSSMTTVFWDLNSKDVYLMANRLPAAAKDKQYQLWALVDGKPVDAGMIDPSCTSLCKMKNIPRAQAFAITLEKAGGSPAPTMTQLFVMGNV